MASATLNERLAAMRDLLDRAGFLPLTDARVLDVGCGHGKDLERLRAWGARPENLYGVDPQQERITTARELHPALTFTCGGAQDLEYEDGFFDLVLMCTIMTSVLDEDVARAIAAEVGRVLRPGGAVLWYDFRYPSPTNRNTRPVTWRHLKRYFPGWEGERRTITLLPPLARRLGAAEERLYPLLARVPLLRSHRIALLRKPAAAGERAA